MSTIQKFKNVSPQLADEVDGYEVLCTILTEENVKDLIKEHYSDRVIAFDDSTKNPELEYYKDVTGLQYVRYYFNSIFGIDWKKAYNNI